jgi:omega-6 fatty acid desaturase (delta-12 desaturase)
LRVESAAADLRECRRDIASRHVKPKNLSGSLQVLTTLAPLAGLWYCASLPTLLPGWQPAAIVAMMSLFLVRAFVLLHDCGHGSLFRTPALNRSFGFVLGVISGIPQQVWSLNHLYHHATNGNWFRYRGPLNIISALEYGLLTRRQQGRYRMSRNLWLAPFGGFLYLVVSPRLNWLRASAGLVRHLAAGRRADPGRPLRSIAADYSEPCCESIQAYVAMSTNNVALLALWAAMSLAIGPGTFFAYCFASLSLAGGAAIVLFTVQHNFEHSYASNDAGWNSTAAVLQGTSFLVLPAWLNWFTASIGYHHVHHLCAGVPNYRLARCHDEQAHMFSDVRRIRLSQIPRSLKCILWDTDARRIISVAEHSRQVAEAAAVA